MYVRLIYNLYITYIYLLLIYWAITKLYMRLLRSDTRVYIRSYTCLYIRKTYISAYIDNP